jgi:hypothetical protein
MGRAGNIRVQLILLLQQILTVNSWEQNLQIIPFLNGFF